MNVAVIVAHSSEIHKDTGLKKKKRKLNMSITFIYMIHKVKFSSIIDVGTDDMTHQMASLIYGITSLSTFQRINRRIND